MTAPLNLSVQYSGTTLRIIFDRAVSATLGQELDGFTFLDDCTSVTPVFSSIDQNAIIATLPGAVTGTLTAAYVESSGTVVDAVSPDPVADFNATAVETYAQPTARRGEAGLNGNDAVTIFFDEPVASPTGDAVTGFTIEVNDVALDLTSATASYNADQTELTIATGTNIAYNDTVDVAYDSGTGDLYTWPSGAVGTFALNAITNVSTDGLPNSSYPLSHVISLPVEITNNIARGTLQISLNPVDIELVARYGPVTVMTGGTFGVTVDNPDGIAVTGSTVTIVDGTEIVQGFQSATNVAWAADAARDWMSTITTKIGIELGKIRATDQTVTLGDKTVTAV